MNTIKARLGAAVQNSKLVFLIFIALFLSGCVRNVDLRKQSENENQKPESISSMREAAELEGNAGQAAASEKPKISEKKPVKILFVGDMMFDRHIREAVQKYGDSDYGYVLSLLKEKLFQYDFVVGNLEGPITENESVSVNTKIGEGKNFIFTFDPSVSRVLSENNIQLVNLGNNHILNQGEKGLEWTKKYLDEAGVGYFDEDSTFIKEINGMKIGFVSYNYAVSDSTEDAIEAISSAKEQADIVIVCPHWGTEYKVGDPGEAVRALARRFVESGADAVIGTHPHVVQNSEEYDGKKIYYSLGNFVFDQYFQPETMEGLGVEVSKNEAGDMEYNELNFVMNKRGQTELMKN